MRSSKAYLPLVLCAAVLTGCATLDQPARGIAASLKEPTPPVALTAGTDWEHARQAASGPSSIDHDPAVSRLTPLVKQNPEENLKKLVDALVAGRSDDFERVRVIHDWIAQNIAYDFAAFQGNAPTITDSYAVIRHGSSVCEGYSSLFTLMCTMAGVDSRVVVGYGRGYGFDPFDEDSQPCKSQHAWNAVQVHGGWYLVDTTWDAGAIDGRTNAFKWRYSTGYLFTPPEVFLCTHFPEQPQWQLRAHPLNLSQLRVQPFLAGEFGALGFVSKSILQRVASVGEEEEVVMRAPPHMRLGAFLSHDGSPDDSSFSQVALKQDGEDVRLKIMFPEAGRYQLALNAFREGDTTSPIFIGELFYISTGGSQNRVAFLLPQARASGFSMDAEDGYVYRVGAIASFVFNYRGDVLASLQDRSGKDFPNRISITRDGNRQVATVSFPAPGEYTVWMMTNTKADPDNWTGMVSLSYLAQAGTDLEYPSLRRQAFSMGLSLDCQQGYNPMVGAETQFSLRVSAPVLVSLSDSGNKDLHGRVFVMTHGDLKTVKVSFPGPGSYTVWISVQSQEKADSWEGAASLHFVAGGTGPVFPTVFLDGAKLGFQIIAPLDGRLKAGQDVAFEVTGPPTGVVFVQVGKSSVRLLGGAGHFRGTVHVTSGQVIVFGGPKPGATLVGLAEYQAN